jgi:tripartite-type tricarboxylate transporter receptor subunit TctC
LKPYKSLIGTVAAACASLAFCTAQAEPAWPTHAITLVVPFAAGGGGDTLARLMAEPLGRELGQTIIVENRPGAGGNIGTSIAARANPDGYTLAYGTNGTQATNHWLYKSPGYAPGDFEPVSRFTIIAAALVVNSADERFKTLEQLIAYAKSRPGELTCGSAGNGTSSHLACELLNQMAGIKVMHIPYKGGGAAMTDLLGGRISFMIDVMPNVSGQIAAGKLRALGVTTPERVASNPDIPTVSEAGVKGYEFYAWDGLYAPKGTPAAVLDKLNAALNQVLQKPEVRKMLESRGAIPSPTTRAGLKDFGAEEYERLGKVVKTAGASID